MARAKPHTNLLDLVGSDSEDDLGGRPGAAATSTSNSKASKMADGKKGRAGTGAAAANKVTKPAQRSTGRRTSGRLAAAVEQAGGRQVLADKTNEQAAAPPPPAKKRGRKPAAGQEEEAADEAEVEAPPPSKAKGTRGRPKGGKAAAQAAPEPAARPTAPRGRKPPPPEESALEETEIPETQPADLMDIDVGEDDTLADNEPSSLQPAQAHSAMRRAAIPARATSTVRRPVSASGLTDTSDIALRRKLGELTKKYETLESKYRDLRDIGVKEAERNFDRLKRQGEDKAKVSNELIASLKSELAAQKELAKEGARYRKQWEASEAKVDSLQSKIAETATALSEARTELKTLSAKLAAARSAEATVGKVPGSALKAKPGAAATGLASSSSQAAQMKEDLYADLTGLIIRGVRRDGDEDVYDCIQTGRNGTLHFKLSVGGGAPGDNYDEAQFMYMPQLDAGRDRALVELLPDYLVDEITFPRPQAAKFYARVMRSLTERTE